MLIENYLLPLLVDQVNINQRVFEGIVVFEKLVAFFTYPFDELFGAQCVVGFSGNKLDNNDLASNP